MSYYRISVLENPNSRYAECYRTLRTNIHFASSSNKVKTIVITSGSADEGKTTISINLAVTIANAGSKTLLMDCDMRKPKIHRYFKLSNTLGLSDLLVGDSSIGEAVLHTCVENLFLLPAGTRPPNPSELLTSNRMEGLINDVENEFDYIIVDTPPVLLVTDAQIISKYADGSILIAAAGETQGDTIDKSREMLEKVNARILGVVLNKMEISKKSYYRKYGNYYSVEKYKRRKKKKTRLIIMLCLMNRYR